MPCIHCIHTDMSCIHTDMPCIHTCHLCIHAMHSYMPCIPTVPYIPCIHSYIHSYMACVHTFIAFIHVIHSYLHVMHSFLHAFIHTCIRQYMPRIASYFPCTCIHTHTVMRSYFPYIHSYMHAMHWYMSCIQYSYMPWVHKLTCHVLTTRVERIPLLMLGCTVTTARLVDFQTACDTCVRAPLCRCATVLRQYADARDYLSNLRVDGAKLKSIVMFSHSPMDFTKILFSVITSALILWRMSTAFGERDWTPP